MSTNDKSNERARRDAERRASERRARLEAAGAFGAPPSTPAPLPPRQDTNPRQAPIPPTLGAQQLTTQPNSLQAHAVSHHDHPGSPPRRFTITGLALLFSLSSALAALSGLPIAGHGWSPVGFVPAAVSAGTGYFLIRALSRSGFGSKVVASIIMLLTATVSVLGVTQQVMVQDRPVLRNSTEDRASRLAEKVLFDLQVLEENGKLLDLPFEQARGIDSLYEAAIRQDLDIAARWNPAVNSEVPLPGFSTVFDLVNRLADLQARTLGMYRDDLRQPDTARQQEIAENRVAIIELLVGPNGAAATLADTVRPLGIELSVEEKP